MNIVLGEKSVNDLLIDDVNQRYVVLELDTFRLSDHEPVKSYCVVDSIPMTEIPLQQQWSELHQKLMENYRKKNWNFCLQALEHLQGRWNGHLDSFYMIMRQRIESLSQQELSPDWDGAIER